jgi:SAM-dependent methyltransferase
VCVFVGGSTTTPAEGAALESDWDLERLARARRLGDWMFEQFSDLVRGSVAEVGAGIGTFSERVLAAGAERLVLIEPAPACAATLTAKFARDPRVSVAAEMLPDAPALGVGEHDLIVCQNVLEHIEDDLAATRRMARALAPGGALFLLVPAHPRLYGSLDRAYGHYRRYTPDRLRHVVTESGLELADVYRFNALGVPGWWLSSLRGSAEIGERALAAYELMVRAWRPVERRIRPRWGLSLIVRATLPATT